MHVDGLLVCTSSTCCKFERSKKHRISWWANIIQPLMLLCEKSLAIVILAYARVDIIKDL